MKAPAVALISIAIFAPIAHSAEVTFITCDNGLRCFRPPCPSRDTVLLPSGRRLARIEPDLSALTEAQRRQLLDKSALYHGTVVLAGTLEETPAVRIAARSIVRTATKAEAELCRRRR